VKEVLSPEGLRDLHAFINRATLFAFDLDGTLAPIVATPAAVMIPEAVRHSLQELSACAVTAVITGRARADAVTRLGFTPRYVVGNHGGEGLPGEITDLSPLQKLVEQWLRQLQALLAPEVWSAIFVEQKGVSLSLHYRHAQQHAAVHGALLDAIKWLDPQPRRVSGKYVENLIPAQAPHKGDALRRLMAHSGCGRALFVGDDVTDEDVFRLSGPQLFTINVGTERETAARYYLAEQARMAQLLDQITIHLQVR